MESVDSGDTRYRESKKERTEICGGSGVISRICQRPGTGETQGITEGDSS